jgi:hypothetical protein
LAHLQILGRLNVDYCSTIKLNIVTWLFDCCAQHIIIGVFHLVLVLHPACHGHKT